QLRNALRSGLSLPAPAIEAALSRANVDPKRRAETLTLREWTALAEALPLPHMGEGRRGGSGRG
ncbi:MAG: hypothetical protein ACRDGG_06805, partial [Anaerolineae bacterium]